MVKIAFHDNQLCERGTTISLYDYAYYNKHLLGNETIILYNPNHSTKSVDEVVEKFKKEFQVFPYTNWNKQANEILKRENCDILYMQKAGDWDGKMANPDVCKTVIHCVFNTSYKHGDVYARISDCFGSNYPVVNYMVNLPIVNEDMREKLNIPSDAIVLGRHGGMDQFNILYVQQAIDEITDKNENIYFIFVNTQKFCKIKNIIHLNKIIDLNEKVKFINTCDGMIHARQMGETFGAAVSEFSIKNKPVITCKGYDNAHLDILNEKCFIYYDKASVLDIFENFINNINSIKVKEWNAYKNYTPENIMKKFNEVFIEPCIKEKKQLENHDVKSYNAHNKEYEEESAFIREKNSHNQKTKSSELKDGGTWDNLYKPGHLHGIWLDKNKKINQCIDIGCGTGWFVNYLNSKYNFPLNNIYGIEPSQSAIDIAKKIYPDTARKINYKCGFRRRIIKNKFK